MGIFTAREEYQLLQKCKFSFNMKKVSLDSGTNGFIIYKSMKGPGFWRFENGSGERVNLL